MSDSNNNPILNAVKMAWGVLTKLSPSIGANPLASVVYSLLTFGLDTADAVYDDWKKDVLSKSVMITIINVDPDPDVVRNYLNGNIDYKEAFKQELADYDNNDAFLSDAYIALHYLNDNSSLFQQVIDSKNYRAYVCMYERLKPSLLADGQTQQNLYGDIQNALNAIESDSASKKALEDLFSTITGNIGQLPDNFWSNLEKILA